MSPATHIDQISLPEINANVSATQICRSCTHRDNHSWNISNMEMMKRMIDGEEKEDIECNPRTDTMTVRVLETINSRGRILPIGLPANLPTRALVDTCGFDQRMECKGCDRFVPIQTRVPYTKTMVPDGPGQDAPMRPAKVMWVTEQRNGSESVVARAEDGSTVFWWKVTVGGHCSLPVEGIVVDGQRRYCDPKPRKIAIEDPSCDNCQWLDYAGEAWQTDYLTMNDNATLTPWERDMAWELVNEDVNYPMALGIMTKRKQQFGFTWTGSRPALNRANGRVMWFRARVVKEAWHEGQYKFRLQFADSPILAVIADDDERFAIHRTDDPLIVGVEIRWPWHKMFRLPDRLMNYTLWWPDLPKPTLVEKDLSHLADPNCPRCKPPTDFVKTPDRFPEENLPGDVWVLRKAKPCAYHAKAPQKSDLTGEITFEGTGHESEWVYPAHGVLDVVEQGGEVFVVDGNGNRPVTYEDGEPIANVAVFRMWLPTLAARARRKFGPEAEAAIKEQYLERWRMLHRSTRPRPTRPTWYVNSGIEPSKPRCTNPGGLNLRKVFADSFGSERTDWDFDTGAQTVMAVDEELRVGFRQHNLTPQRLHEEILSNMTADPNYDHRSHSIARPDVQVPETFVYIKLPGIGGMTRDDGTPVDDAAEFMDRLDEDVIVGTIGDSDKPRFMSKRMQMFGYDLSRGYYGKRTGGDKTAMPSRDRDIVIFGDDENDDQMDVSSDWRCVDCGRVYNQGEIGDYFYPICDDCGTDLYKIHNTREIFNPRGDGGVGNAIVMDTERMRQRKRLQATVCPHWQLRGSTDITLEQTSGPTKYAAPPAPKFVEKDPVEIVKVKQAVLTEEQKAHNTAYWAQDEAVKLARQEYLDEYPDTKPSDLVAKFPRPKGKIYQLQAAGSLAKMGSM